LSPAAINSLAATRSPLPWITNPTACPSELTDTDEPSDDDRLRPDPRLPTPVRGRTGQVVRAGHDGHVGSPWEPREQEAVELEVETRPPSEHRVQGAALPATSGQSVNAARKAARLLGVVAWVIPAVSAVGYVLTLFWNDDQGFPGESIRQRIGSLFSFVWVPLALGALVYAMSFALMLYATRIELDTARAAGPSNR
jgi:hypothetical protein